MKIDSTLSAIEIDIPSGISEGKFCENLRMIFDLFRGVPYILRLDDIESISMVANSLGIEFILKLVEKFTKKPESIDDAIQIFFDSDPNQIEKAIDFFAEHYYEVTKELIPRIPFSILEKVYSSNKLKVHSEDSLFEHFIYFYQINKKSNSFVQIF